MRFFARPIPRLADLPRCEAERTEPYANDTAATNKRCKRSAKFNVDGRSYCTRHAEAVSLSLLLSVSP
jgi:uncharacterized protein (DUF2461 family)